MAPTPSAGPLLLRPDAVLDGPADCPSSTASRPPLASSLADPDIGIIVLTMFDQDESIFAAMRAGARGYLLKGAEQQEILRAIRAVAQGEALFGPEVARRLIAFFNTAEDFAGRRRSRSSRRESARSWT